MQLLVGLDEQDCRGVGLEYLDDAPEQRIEQILQREMLEGDLRDPLELPQRGRGCLRLGARRPLPLLGQASVGRLLHDRPDADRLAVRADDRVVARRPVP